MHRFQTGYSPNWGGVKLWATLRVKRQQKGFLAEAKRLYDQGGALGSFEDYQMALERHWVSYKEYADQYEFYKKNEDERNEYVSRLRMAYFYWRYTPGTAKAVFRNKMRFLSTFKDYVHRKWMYVPDAKYDDFKGLITSLDCIVKPVDGKLGRGVFKTTASDVTKENIRELYDYCVKNKCQLEECIDSCDELKRLHPESLNTIRVVTIANKNKACVFGSFLRMGVGKNVVDNAHAGGVFAHIDIKTGIVITDGTDTAGNKYVVHPDSQIRLRGLQIPMWNDIVKTCCDAAKVIGNPMTGWDVAINSRGMIQFVEGNYGPDFDVMQPENGVKKQLYSLIKEYCGIEMQ